MRERETEKGREGGREVERGGREREEREPYFLLVLQGATLQAVLVTSPSERGSGPLG